MGTARARIGYAIVDNLLLYGTGGLAYGNVHASSAQFNVSNIKFFESTNAAPKPGRDYSYMNPVAFGTGNYSGFKAGWAAGGGAEWMFAENWSARAEGMYYNLGNVTMGSSALATTCSSQAQNATNTACARGAASTTRLIPGQLLWTSIPTTKIQFDGIIARAGVNYHFNWGAETEKVAF